MEELKVIKESDELLNIINSEDVIVDEIHFFQGQNDYFKKNSSIEGDKLNVVKDKIKEFFNIKNVHFLFGSGTSAPAIPTMAGLMSAICENEMEDDENKQFKRIAKVKGNNIEEILGVLYSQKAYLEGVGKRKSSKYVRSIALIEKIERIIYNKLTPCLDATGMTEVSQKVLENYKLLYSKVTNRNKDLSRINVFTTNNDLFNETALDRLNIHYINGFSGGLKKYFNPAFFNYTFSKRMDTSLEKFEPVNNMVYLYKIHGSVNWILDETNDNSYFKIKELCEPRKNYDGAIMIYPTPLKQNKSLASPYVDLFREFQHKLLEPNSVLFIIGYSFSDEHINDIIYRSLVTNSSLILVIINNLSPEQPICKSNDNRIFRFWGTSGDGKVNYHYFDYFTKNLIPDFEVETCQRSESIEQLIRGINENKNSNNENRKNNLC